MISQEDFIFIRDYDNAQSDRRDQLIQSLGPTCAKTFIRLMGRIAKEQTVRYILTTIDDMIKVGKKFLQHPSMHDSLEECVVYHLLKWIDPSDC